MIDNEMQFPPHHQYNDVLGTDMLLLASCPLCCQAPPSIAEAGDVEAKERWLGNQLWQTQGVWAADNSKQQEQGCKTTTRNKRGLWRMTTINNSRQQPVVQQRWAVDGTMRVGGGHRMAGN
jgi:hypothetical protein